MSSCRAYYAYSPRGHNKWAAFGHPHRGLHGPSRTRVDDEIYITWTKAYLQGHTRGKCELALCPLKYLKHTPKVTFKLTTRGRHNYKKWVWRNTNQATNQKLFVQSLQNSQDMLHNNV